MDHVQTGFLHHDRDGLAVLDREAALDKFIRGDTHVDNEIVAAFFADIRDDLTGEAGAVPEVAAVLVQTFVGIGGEELCDQVAVSTMDLDAVKSALFGAQGGVAVFGHHILYFLCCEWNGNLISEGTGDGAGGSGVTSLGNAVRRCLPAAVIDLSQDGRAVLVDAFGELRVALDLSVVPESGCAAESVAFGGNIVIFCDDETPAAFGLGLMVGEIALGRSAVYVAEIGYHGGNCEAILYSVSFDCDRAEYVVKHDSLLSEIPESAELGFSFTIFMLFEILHRIYSEYLPDLTVELLEK